MRLFALQAIKNQACDVLRNYLWNHKNDSVCKDDQCQSRPGSWGQHQAWAELYHQLHGLPKNLVFETKDK